MSDIIKPSNHIPAPKRDREGHVPAPGDIYYGKDPHYPRIYRILSVTEKSNTPCYHCEQYDLLTGVWNEWEKDRAISGNDLKEYYILLLGDFSEIISVARAAVGGDPSGLDALMEKTDDSPETMALVASRPADQVYALTEAAERLQDKVDTIGDHMRMIVESIRAEMDARIRSLDRKLERINDYVRNLQRVITVMNLYTGRNVDVTVVCDGTPAPPGTVIHVRQRILFMDEEYLADAQWGGIDCNDTGRFCEWLHHPENRNTVCPEERCIVAVKPKRYDKGYSSDPWTNAELNRWNHHTMVFFRDGERLLLIDSEELELYGTAIPYSDQMERYEKEYQKIMSERSFQETELKRLKDRSERLGYMYTKYISFLQGVVDSGQIYDMSAGRPNFAKEEGVAFIRDDENAIGTGEDWHAFQKRLNASIRRGTRVVFFPYGQDEHGNTVSCGETNRYYWHDCNRPAPPKSGVYNVDYPSKTDRVANKETGRWEKVTKKGDRLALFYTPGNPWKWDDSIKDRAEAWIYNPWCVLNYDALTIEDIDRFMADRTQRPHFRLWMPVLQEARKQLVKEKEDEDAFILALGHSIHNEHPEIHQKCIRGLVEEAVHWWKNKVIFTRPLRSDDAKAWRMIKNNAIQNWKNNK